MTISQVLTFYKSKGLPEREALALISFVMKKPKEYIIAHSDITCPQEAIELINKRLTGYPLQYIVGEVEFYKRKFYVEEGVLIPRWETEGLVELAIEYIEKYNITNVLEIGVGSGVIIVSLAAECDINAYGTDINPKAVELTLKNAKRHNVHVDVKLGNFIEPFEKIIDKIELIVSNPPYVKKGTFLQEELYYEPEEALFGGEDGLEFYVEFFRRYNTLGKIVIMEIGHDQGEALKILTGGIIKKDIADKDRYLIVDMFNKTEK